MATGNIENGNKGLRAGVGLARVAALAVALLLLAAGCASPQICRRTPPDRPAVERVRERGVLLVGSTGDYRPLTWRDPETGRWEGFGVEIAERLAAELGVRAEFVQTSWPTLAADVQAVPPLFDIAIGGITITDARLASMDMSEGYLANGKTILCRAADAGRFRSLSDIDRPDVRVMVNPGGLNESFARAKLPNARLLVHGRNEEIPGLVAEGRADVMVTEIVEAPWYVRNDPRLAAPLLGEPFTHGEIGVLMRKGQDDLLAFVNDALRRLAADGTLDALRQRHGLAAMPVVSTAAGADDPSGSGTSAPPTIAVPGFAGVRMAVFPVTNGDYARFYKDTGHKPPAYWKDGAPPAGREKHPVVEVSLSDAEAYAAWLTARTPGVRFRIPTEEEWVAAAQGSVPAVFNGPLVARLLAEDAGREVEFVHPKSARRGEKVRLADVLSLSERGSVRGWADHARHCGFIDTDLFRTLSADGGATAPVDAQDASRSAIGCRDMAGNTWDWTSTVREARSGAERGRLVNVVKGGSWYANRTSCLPGFEGEGRAASGHYNTVGFRLAAETSPATPPAKDSPAMNTEPPEKNQ